MSLKYSLFYLVVLMTCENDLVVEVNNSMLPTEALYETKTDNIVQNYTYITFFFQTFLKFSIWSEHTWKT